MKRATYRVHLDETLCDQEFRAETLDNEVGVERFRRRLRNAAFDIRRVAINLPVDGLHAVSLARHSRLHHVERHYAEVARGAAVHAAYRRALEYGFAAGGEAQGRADVHQLAHGIGVELHQFSGGDRGAYRAESPARVDRELDLGGAVDATARLVSHDDREQQIRSG